MNRAPILELDGVEKVYGRRDRRVEALAGVSLSLAPGEFAAVRGPSGCGKSTLLLIAGGLLAPDRGRVRVGDVDLYALSSDERAALRARELGYVFQQFHLVPYLSVEENVLARSLAPGSRSASSSRARELLDRFRLTERARHLPSELSTGERQRCALARALLGEPRLLLADEPTGNLDEANASHVLGALREFADAGGAVLLVTHDAAAAARADRTIWLERGALATGPHVEGGAA